MTAHPWQHPGEEGSRIRYSAEARERTSKREDALCFLAITRDLEIVIGPTRYLEDVLPLARKLTDTYGMLVIVDNLGRHMATCCYAGLVNYEAQERVVRAWNASVA
jgi:hypothetical protein